MISPERLPARETESEPQILFGCHFPKTEISNAEIESWRVITNAGNLLTAEAIYEKTGVERRYVATSYETVLTMGIAAAKPLIEKYGKDFAVIIFSTSYPTGKHLATQTAYSLRLNTFNVFDIYYACSGFVSALNYLEDYKDWFAQRRVLVITSEKYSPTLPNLAEGEQDSSFSQTIFSDGAIASSFVYGKDLKVLALKNYQFNLDESQALKMPIDYDLIKPPAKFIWIPPSCNGKFTMDGKKVYAAVVRKMPGLITEAVFSAGLRLDDVDLVIPHQASRHMLDGIAKRLSPVLSEKMVYDLEDGNFSSASIPKAWMKAAAEGRIKPGAKIVLAAVGAGLFASVAVVEVH